jgi:hypothetical protein
MKMKIEVKPERPSRRRTIRAHPSRKGQTGWSSPQPRDALAIRGASAQTAVMPSAPRWQPERSEIRASDAERERVVSFLRDKTAEGRLTADELDERVGRAYAAVTQGELRRLVRDLPDPPFGRRTAWSHPRHRGAVIAGMAGFAALRLPGLALLVVMTALALTIAMVALLAVLAVTLGPLIALFVFMFALRRRAGRCGALRYR